MSELIHVCCCGKYSLTMSKDKFSFFGIKLAVLKTKRTTTDLNFVSDSRHNNRK